MTESEPDPTIFERRDPLVGNLLDGRFRIDARLAAGGFGAIYRATELASKRELALKVLHGNLAADPSMVARFRREGELLASLRDPHTVTAYELGETADGTLYIAMELLRGETLYEAYKKQGGPLPWRRVTAIARAVCSSLAEAHALGIVHRDLKPANIHLQERGGNRDFVKVLDFGIAKSLRGVEEGEELTQAGQMIGTFEYMAPEQMLGGVVGARCDIYTLGVVMYEMLAGRMPFADATSPTHLLAMLLTTTPPPVASLVPVPPALDRAVMRCLEREQQDRFASVAELAAALDGVLAGVGVQEGPTLAGDEPTCVVHRADARGSAPVLAPPRAAGGPPTHLTPARGAQLRDAIAPAAPIEPLPVRAAGSQPCITPIRRDGRASQPPMRNDGRASQPPVHAPVGAYETTVPARGLARASQPVVDPRAPYPVVAAPHAQPAFAAPYGQPVLAAPPPQPYPHPQRPTPPRPAGIPQSIDPLALAYPRPQPYAEGRGSQAIPYPVADARGSRPYFDPRVHQPALAAGPAWPQHHHPRCPAAGIDTGGFDAARDAAVRRAVWALVIVLGAVLALVVGKLL